MANRNVLIGALAGLALVVAGGIYGLTGSGGTKSNTETAPGAPSETPAKVAETNPADGGTCKPIGTFEIGPRDIILGSIDAPITIIEYASMTCPHCAHVHETVLPKIKADYIDKGLARFVFREFPIDQVALAAAVLTRCVSKEAYHPFLATLFAQQRNWAAAESGEAIRASLKEISARAGLNDAAFEACLKNKAEAEAVIKSRDEGLKNYCIGGTPTTIMNGRVLSDQEAQVYEKLDAILRAELQKLGKLPAGMAPPPAATAPAPDAPAAPASPAPATPAPATPAPATP